MQKQKQKQTEIQSKKGVSNKKWKMQIQKQITKYKSKKIQKAPKMYDWYRIQITNEGSKLKNNMLIMWNTGGNKGIWYANTINIARTETSKCKLKKTSYWMGKTKGHKSRGQLSESRTMQLKSRQEHKRNFFWAMENTLKGIPLMGQVLTNQFEGGRSN